MQRPSPKVRLLFFNSYRESKNNFGEWFVKLFPTEMMSDSRNVITVMTMPRERFSLDKSISDTHDMCFPLFCCQ